MIYLTGQRPHPHHVRAATFDTRWRGLDPTQVHDYLHRVADELDRLHRDLTTANTESERIRQALRQWQTRHTHCHHHPTNAPDATGTGTPGTANSRWPR
ncbi:DivIVA domain-containing protein [Micromonospora sp. WMMA1363]|uniref:DivIVA domain-containing protein n=1 Tax=Micromonospora sp. WMMA1363 TaxID=3053985 RepID=UPI00259D176A|nr:DivIVA domain-containing protein [Micromonospora sp. WMMA1363]MDM4722660.1 DivIVA domain-containing protein [Micromonospora sp. WMMA1363]